MPVFCIVYVSGRGSENRDVCVVEPHCQVVRNLASHAQHYSVRSFHLVDVHHPLVCELVKIQAVAHVVVRRFGFRVVVYHHTPPAAFAQGAQTVYAAPVKLHRTAYAVGSAAKDDDGLAVFFVVYVVEPSVIGKVKVICLCREFCSQCVYLLDYRQDAERFPVLAYQNRKSVGVFPVLEHESSYLEVGEAVFLGHSHRMLVYVSEVIEAGQVFSNKIYVVEFFKEPLVYLGGLMDPVYGVSCLKSLGYYEDAAVGRLFQLFLDVIYLHLLVAYEAVSSAAYHPEAFLDYLLKAASNCHDLSNGFHAAAYEAADSVELGKVPARDLADYVVQGRFKECRSCLGNGVLQVKQSVAESELCGNKSQRITRGLGGKRRRAAEPCIDFNYPVILALWVKGILPIAFAYNSYVAYYLDGQFPEQMELMVCQGL